MKFVVVVVAVIVAVFLLKRPVSLHFYLTLAIGRTTRLLRFLQHFLTGNKDAEPEIQSQVEWMNCQKLQHLSIESGDGCKLSGMLLTHPQAKRIVIMFHGWRGTWEKDDSALAHGLYEQGCSILMTEQRAHGHSEGKYIGFGVLEKEDCRRWAFEMADCFPELPIYLSGVSMGASTVLMAVGEELPEQVKGVIADCGFTSPYAMVRIFAEKFMHMEGEKADRNLEAMNRLCRKKAGYDLREYSTVEAMQKCKLPVFFAHGTGDHFVPYEMSVENYAACSGPKTFFAVEGAGHTKSYISEPQKYMDALTRFFCWDTPKTALQR